MAEILQNITSVAAMITALFSMIMIFVKPFRVWLSQTKTQKQEELRRDEDSKEVNKCLLRDRILEIYYNHNEKREIKEYEFENVGYMREQYKKLDGNSFVDKVWEEMQGWKVVR